MSKPRWPEEVPILTANDICRDRRHGGDDTNCLAGWKEVVFGLGWSDSPMHSKTWRAIEIAVGKDETIPAFNDDRNNSLDDVARVWNRAMALLGYVCGNPEAKWAEQHKRKVRKA